MPRSPQQAFEELIRREKERSTLGSALAILGWDERTYLPRAGAAFRAEQIALLARMMHELLTQPAVGELLDELDHPHPDPFPLKGEGDRKEPPHPGPLPRWGEGERVNIREIKRNYDRAIKLPKSLVEELARATTLGQHHWQESRNKNDYALFQPHLEKIIHLKRQEAEAVGYEANIYDALLDEFEPGATSATISETFAGLRDELSPFIQSIMNSGRAAPRNILERNFPVDKQQIFGQAAAAAIGFDFAGGRLDVTTHPFCTGIGPGDCRITTRYNAHHFNESFFGTLHEAGHGIYEQGLDAQHFGTPMGQATSLGIHESQSRMWENFVGRSRPFWDHFFPIAQQIFIDTLSDVSLDDWMFAINDVRPSFIRVEADEATYNLHIILRFELEQALLTGDLPVADLPGAWNEKFAQYFDLTPPDDAQGCLQDIHWSGGAIGYFPTYTLGNLYAAQFMETAREEIPDLDEQFADGNFRAIKSWLNEKIHRPGQTYRAPELCEKVTGEPLSSRPLMGHLRGKLAALYGV